MRLFIAPTFYDRLSTLNFVSKHYVSFEMKFPISCGKNNEKISI